MSRGLTRLVLLLAAALLAGFRPAGPALQRARRSVPNLSFKREFGRMMGSLDVLSRIIADKDNRTVVRMLQSVATAVFLPVK